MNILSYLDDYILRVTGLATETYLFIGTVSVSIPILERLISRGNGMRIDNLVLVEVSAFVIFTLLVTVNFVTANAANKVKQTTDVRNIFWEVLGSVFLNTMIAFLGVTAILLDQEYLYIGGLWLIVFFWFLVLGIQYQDIGNSLTILNNGHKPDIFAAFDRIFIIVKRSAERKLEKTISGDTYLNDNQDNGNYNEEFKDEP